MSGLATILDMDGDDGFAVKLVTVRVAPSLNGLVLLFGLIWFSVKWAEASIGLVWFGFSYTMGWFGMV